MGEPGVGLPSGLGRPAGLQLVIQGKFDHAIIPIAEIDEAAEWLTARTINTDLLARVAADRNELRAEVYEDGQAQQGMGQATVELVGDLFDGWFTVVHMDESLCRFSRRLNDR